MILIRKFSTYSTTKKIEHAFVETHEDSRGIQVPKITILDASWPDHQEEIKPIAKYATLKTTFSFYLNCSEVDENNKPIRELYIRVYEEQSII
jgi:hypothetical protein